LTMRNSAFLCGILWSVWSLCDAMRVRLATKVVRRGSNSGVKMTIKCLRVVTLGNQIIVSQPGINNESRMLLP